MDMDNLGILQHSSDEEHHGKISLFLDFSMTAKGGEVPDPYYGGTTGFERVLDLIEQASAGLLAEIRQQHRL